MINFSAKIEWLTGWKSIETKYIASLLIRTLSKSNWSIVQMSEVTVITPLILCHLALNQNFSYV